MNKRLPHDLVSKSFAGTDLLENVSEGIYSLDADWNVTFLNAVAEGDFDCDRREVLGHKVWEVFPGLFETALGRGLRDAMTARERRDVTDVCPRTDRLIEARAFPLQDGGLGVTWRDAPPRPAHEAALEQALKTQELLYVELAHRVTNHFQEVASRLMLQAKDIRDEPSREAFLGIAASVRCMALVNSRLYRDQKGIDDQDLGAYLSGLAQDLRDALLPPHVTLSAVVENGLIVSAEVATLVGMIVAELMTNARKHAWAPDQPGSICVRVHRSGMLIEVEVSDDGRGLPDARPEGVGMPLLDRQVASLKGDFQAESAPGGATFRLRFPAR